MSGVAFLLGTIMWTLRTAGSEIQHGLGLSVKVLQMPARAKLFVVLMMVGLMTSIAQFVGYLIVAGRGVDAPSWMAFLGPLREFGLAMILSGITMALISIGTALRFQFDRAIEMVRTGS